tara:strand:- start:182 stop:472 length:291 start_codon:yes stop_codon:yes gene_type:complete
MASELELHLKLGMVVQEVGQVSGVELKLVLAALAVLLAQDLELDQVAVVQDTEENLVRLVLAQVVNQHLNQHLKQHLKRLQLQRKLPIWDKVTLKK